MVGLLNRHTRSVHNNINYECDICEKSFSETGNLKRHFRSVHDGGYKCDLRRKSYSRPEILKNHKCQWHSKFHK